MFYFLQLGHFLGDKDIWTGLSDELKLYLSRSVASITLCDGNYTCLAFLAFQLIYIETHPAINDLNCDLL
jgi:hypothetical protein